MNIQEFGWMLYNLLDARLWQPCIFVDRSTMWMVRSCSHHVSHLWQTAFTHHCHYCFKSEGDYCLLWWATQLMCSNSTRASYTFSWNFLLFIFIFQVTQQYLIVNILCNRLDGIAEKTEHHASLKIVIIQQLRTELHRQPQLRKTTLTRVAPKSDEWWWGNISAPRHSEALEMEAGLRLKQTKKNPKSSNVNKTLTKDYNANNPQTRKAHVSLQRFRPDMQYTISTKLGRHVHWFQKKMAICTALIK